ncbi:MAG: NifB/NifX family molybdenum-iron cluster-binding protein [Candidatus Kapaibacterium sp.]
MKLCFPIVDNDGMGSEIYGHFGSAPRFLVFNTDNEELKLIENANLGHEHGQCNPVEAVSGENIDAVFVQGIGANALVRLNNAGIRVFQAAEGAIENSLMLFKNGQLPEYTLEHSCKGHGHNGGGCSH